MMMRLEAEWRADMSAIGADAGPAAAAFADVVSRHSEPHRRYHGLAHLDALFTLLRRHAPAIAAGSGARLAVWWHDVIYDPKAQDNEERSAIHARDALTSLGCDPGRTGATADLILKTKRHWDSGPAGADGDAFLDADIAILGAPPEIYDRYAAGVREEYGWAPDDLYRKGRGAFLRGALSRQTYFRTSAFETAFAAQARENMARELSRLEAGG